MAEHWLEQAQPCPNCGEPAEPEGDTEMRWWECTDTECGYTFGFQRMTQPGGSCQLGVPEGVRRAASPAAPAAPQVFIPTIRRRPQ